MGKRRKTGKRAVKPDEYFASGPLEFVRFGRTLIGRSRATPDQAAAVQARMAERFPAVVTEIDALVSSIATRIAGLPPDRLLHMAWWEFAMLATGDVARDLERTASLRMVDYVQSVIASVPPDTYAEEISKDEWNALKADVMTLFVRLTAEYQMCLTASRQARNPDLDMELEEFRMHTETLWLNVRGKRYHTHERQALLDVLTPHSDILVRLFGIDAPTLVDELDKILRTLTRGVADSVRGMSALQEEMLNRIDKLASDDGELTPELFEKSMLGDRELAERSSAVFGRIFGMDLFDVAKNTALPQALLDELSWSPGEDTEFFAPGDFRGWPLRIWPTMKRPFIRLDGRVLCFDFFSLFDNFYRVLRRAIVRREPAYAGTWNERQKVVSEELPFLYLGRLLPGARVYRPVYYRWLVGSGPAQWHEADGLLIYDDHLLIIEVKAGAFTYTSPANDLPAHLESLRNLLRAPARQGSRFADYLESAAEVPIADENHREIGRLRRRDFRHVTVCVVTLDSFTELAARAQRLADLGIDVGHRAVWAVSIDDLRVHAELFDSPLVFLHFVEQRTHAGKSEHVDLHDEMDHLGLYFVQNNYSQYATELLADQRKPTKLNLNGFRAPIDDYFGGVLQEEEPARPRQDMPARLAEIIDFLARSNEPRRAELASFLLDGAGDFRKDFCLGIEQALCANKELNRARPVSIHGGMAMTLYVWSHAAPRLKSAAEEHTQAVMLAHGEIARRLVELEYAENGTLVRAHIRHVSLAGLSTTELNRIQRASLELQRRRLEQAANAGSIGRNQPCPCGSGKKFKRCHGANR